MVYHQYALRLTLVWGVVSSFCWVHDANATARVCNHQTIFNHVVQQRQDPSLDAPLQTITANIATRSAGGPNDFYSEGDYWWPSQADPDGPYIRKDGQSNPNNFIAHRLSLMSLADNVAGLTSSYLVTDDTTKQTQLAAKISEHLHAWFVDPKTRMNPHMQFAQAILGHHTGRSIGLIDSLHLVEVALAVKLLNDRQALAADDVIIIKHWFASLAHWMNTHPYGIKEREHPNNHSVAWSLQIAAYATLTSDEALLQVVRQKFQHEYLAVMMNADGGFKKELTRTKPLGYSLFVIDLMAGIAQLASTPEQRLWQYETTEGHSMRLGLDFITPFIRDKSTWPYPRDIEYWDDWPMQHAALLFGSIQFNDCQYFDSVAQQPNHTTTYEIKRNLPIRHPILWLAHKR